MLHDQISTTVMMEKICIIVATSKTHATPYSSHPTRKIVIFMMYLCEEDQPTSMVFVTQEVSLITVIVLHSVLLVQICIILYFVNDVPFALAV